MVRVSAGLVVAAVLALGPLVWAGWFGWGLKRWGERLPGWVRVVGPGGLVVPYVLVTVGYGDFAWRWFGVYLVLPVVVAWMLGEARRVDAAERGDWRDYVVLAVLGLAVDLRWFEGAWPAHLTVFNKMLLLDMGIYGFGVMRGLDGVGFDLRLRQRDVGIGLREFLLYTPIAVGLGLGIGFLHLHLEWPRPMQLVGAFLFTFLFIAVPEELFSGGGCRICWRSGWGGGGRWDVRRCCLGWRTSISGRCISTGDMWCWQR